MSRSLWQGDNGGGSEVMNRGELLAQIVDLHILPSHRNPVLRLEQLARAFRPIKASGFSGKTS